MRHRVGLGLVIWALLTLTPATMVAQSGTAEDASPEYFFVLSSPSGSFDGDTLTLDDVPLVFYFSDRPDRIAGSATIDLARRIFTEEAPFTGLPPNGFLSILDGGTLADIAIELTGAEIDGTSVRLGYEALADPPEMGPFGPATLFIDSTPLGGNWSWSDPFCAAEAGPCPTR